MCVHVCTCILLCTLIHLYTRMHFVQAKIYAHVYIRVHVYVCTRIHLYTRMHFCTGKDSCTYTRIMYMYTFVYMYELTNKFYNKQVSCSCINMLKWMRMYRADGQYRDTQKGHEICTRKIDCLVLSCGITCTYAYVRS
jgi:hypothetical protein